MAMRPLALIGVPSSAGARRVGLELAPRALRRAGLLERLWSRGREVVERGDLPQVTFAPDALRPRQQNLPVVLGLLRQLADVVESTAGDGHVDGQVDGQVPLLLGGDCTLALGVVAGLARHHASLGMLYLDGDLDLNTPATTPSGILDGMVLAHLLGEGVPELAGLGPRQPLLAESDVTLFGYSVASGAIDLPELARLERSAMARYPLEAVADRAAAAAAEALADLERRVEHVYVHFDVDVIDFGDFGGADYPHAPGLSLAAARDALTVFCASPQVVAVAVTEFNPVRDPDGRLAGRLVDVLAGALGG
jgi:arginase